MKKLRLIPAIRCNGVDRWDPKTRILTVCTNSLTAHESHKDTTSLSSQVSSRSLGSGSSSGLVPYMDLLNHSPKARPPMLRLDDDDKV